MTSPRGTRLLDVLSTEMPGPGHCRLLPGDCCCLGSRCHAAQPGSSAQVTMSNLDLWSFESRVFKERKGLLWYIRGLVLFGGRIKEEVPKEWMGAVLSTCVVNP